MSNDYRIDRERRVVWMTRTHRNTGAEFAEFVHAVVTDPDFTLGMCVLDDRRLAEDAPETAEMRVAIRQLNPDRPSLAGTRWAVVLGEAQPAVLGMYNMFCVLVSELGIEMRHFETIDQAKAWLEIE